MIREPNLSFYITDLSYRSPGSTSNGAGTLSGKVEVTRYGLSADADPIGPSLSLALSAVTKTIESAVAAVVDGPIGAEVTRLQTQLTAAIESQNDLAGRVYDLEKKRSEALRAGKPSSPERIREARAAHVHAGELVTEIEALLIEAESRLKSAIQDAKMETIQAASKQVTADLERAEREAAESILTALAPVYVSSAVLRELSRQAQSARTPKATPFDPINVPVSENRGRSIRIESPRVDDEADDDVLAGLPGPPVEVVSSL